MENLKDWFRYNLRLVSITDAVIGLCVLVYLITYILGIYFKSETIALVVLGANVNHYVYLGQIHRLLTSIFLHAGVLHLFVNMYSLKTFGPEIEYTFGRAKFLIIFVVAGIVGNIFSFIASTGSIFLAGSSIESIPLSIGVGASGAIFGLLGYLLGKKMNERNLMMDGKYLNIDLRSLLIVIAVNLVLGFSIPQVDNSAHIGGLVAGFILSFLT